MEDIDKKRLNAYGIKTKRKIIKLTDEGYSYREIAAKKNIPISCISKWVANRKNIENPLYHNTIRKLQEVEENLKLWNMKNIYVNTLMI